MNNKLKQFDEHGSHLRDVLLPDCVKSPQHAVESPAGTFIVSHKNTQLNKWLVSEVNTERRVLRQFSGPLGYTPHIAVDSHGNIFAADSDNRRILLLDAQLALRRVIIDEHQLNYKRSQRLCYVEQSGQLLVGLDFQGNIAVFDVLGLSRHSPVDGAIACADESRLRSRVHIGGFNGWPHVQWPTRPLPKEAPEAPTEGFPWDDLRKMFRGCHRWLRYQVAQKHCRKFQPAE